MSYRIETLHQWLGAALLAFVLTPVSILLANQNETVLMADECDGACRSSALSMQTDILEQILAKALMPDERGRLTRGPAADIGIPQDVLRPDDSSAEQVEKAVANGCLKEIGCNPYDPNLARRDSSELNVTISGGPLIPDSKVLLPAEAQAAKGLTRRSSRSR